jgi:hypothetical protein
MADGPGIPVVGSYIKLEKSKGITTVFGSGITKPTQSNFIVSILGSKEYLSQLI